MSCKWVSEVMEEVSYEEDGRRSSVIGSKSKDFHLLYDGKVVQMKM